MKKFILITFLGLIAFMQVITAEEKTRKSKDPFALDVVKSNTESGIKTIDIYDLTPKLYGSTELADFDISETSMYLNIRHPDLRTFNIEIYNRTGHLVEEYSSSSGLDAKVKIPVEVLQGKTLFLNIKNRDRQVVKTLKCKQSSAYSARD